MPSSVTLGIGVFLTVLAILALGMCFSTDYWAQWRVNRNALKNAKNNSIDKMMNANGIYFTRYYGLWRTCYPGNETNELLGQISVVDTFCELRNYELGISATSDRPTLIANSDYWTMINVLRCQFAFLVCALAMGLFACISGTWGCWKASYNPNFIAGLLNLLGTLLAGGSLGSFHGVHYLETKVVNDGRFYKGWPPILQRNSVWSLQWSYILGWIGVGLMLLATLLFLVESYNIKQDKKRKKQRMQRISDYHSDIDRKSMSGRTSIPPGGMGPQPNGFQGIRPTPKPQPVGDDDRLVPVLVYDNLGQDPLDVYLQTSNYQKYT